MLFYIIHLKLSVGELDLKSLECFKIMMKTRYFLGVFLVKT